MQLLGVLVFHVTMIVLASLEYHETEKALLDHATCALDPSSYVACSGPGTLMGKVSPLLIAVPCILGAGLIAMLICVKYLYIEFGWDIFHVVGADLDAKTMYQFYQVMRCLMKFDLYAYLAIEFQLLVLVLQHGTADYIITLISIPMAVIAFTLTARALRFEIRWMMRACLGTLTSIACFLVYKMVKYYLPSTNGTNPYIGDRNTLTVYTVIGIVLFAITIGVGWRCLRDFGKGLLEAKSHKTALFSALPFTMPGKEKLKMSKRVSDENYTGGAPVTTQISIE